MTTVFFDRTCGRSIPQALKLLGLDVEGHGEHFAHDTPDDVWLREVGERGWIVITNDQRIRTRQNERQALIDYAAGCFAFGQGNRKKWDTVRILARVWDGILEIAATESRPFIYVIHGDARLVRLYPRDS